MAEYDVLMITSGAVGSGKSLISEKRFDDVTNKQIYAAVGQVELMKNYSQLFGEHGKVIAQMLATKEDFESRTHYLNMKNCLESLLQEGIVPIMNENDFVAIEELMFTDNDELAGLVSKMLGADKLIVLTNVDGIYDENEKVVGEFTHDCEVPSYISDTDEKSSFGRGGIQTKFKMAQTAAKNGTSVYIVGSKEKDLIAKVINGEEIGTKFIPNNIT